MPLYVRLYVHDRDKISVESSSILMGINEFAKWLVRPKACP